ncbi:hypothetical protein NPIL_213581 [Nephila pilipes]|uniref:Uncharacterized protein n=1 Tax=Nephila pilipes TaxID=299642 RepID=A0A8X6T6V8_NEPPI|nr:hypothetical protein NPIL_213581 [Nephila pilipes]
MQRKPTDKQSPFSGSAFMKKSLPTLQYPLPINGVRSKLSVSPHPNRMRNPNYTSDVYLSLRSRVTQNLPTDKILFSNQADHAMRNLKWHLLDATAHRGIVLKSLCSQNW